MGKEYLNKEECRQVQIEILKVIDKICEENNLKYYMCGGTLIGAVRHRGFIPWDDDIDIMLFRDDYNRLIEILKSQKEYDYLKLLDIDTPNYYYTFAKLVDDRTVAKMDDNLTEHGLWVDIFPYDNLPENKKERENFINKCYFYRSIVLSMMTDFSAKKVNKKFIKLSLKLYSKIINKNKFINKYNRFLQKYNGINTKYIGCLFSPYRLRECFEKSWFNERIKLEFETEKFWAPKESDKYLTQLYGDYMQLPPVEKRKDHSIIAWRK